MSLLDSILSAANSGAAEQIAGKFGVTSDQVGSLLSGFAPTLASALQSKVADGSLGSLTNLVTQSHEENYAENPEKLGDPQASQLGQNVLTNLFGGSGGLQEVISGLTGKTGLSAGTLSSLLPIVTSFLMSSFSKHAGGDAGQLGSVLGGLTGGEGGGILGALKGAAGKIFGS